MRNAFPFQGLIALIAAGCICGVAQELPVFPFSPSGQPQGPMPPEFQIHFNTTLLTVALALDRQEYLPGEVGELTIAVTNRTQVPLRVWEPFSIRTGEIDLQMRTPEGMQTVEHILRDDIPDGPSVGYSVLLQPGERRQRRIRTYDAQLRDWPDPLLARRSMPLKPGSYRFHYTFGAGADVDFQVMEAHRVGPISRQPIAVKSTAEDLPTSRIRVHALAHFQTGERDFLVISAWGRRDSAPDGAFELTDFPPFIRLDDWQGSMPEVQLDSTEEGAVSVRWRGRGGILMERLIPPPQSCDCIVDVVKK
jgi:hypothetical protein